jgi:anthranilate phosphoribosyltransferase
VALRDVPRGGMRDHGSSPMSLLPHLHRVAGGSGLTSTEAYEAMTALLDGTASESVIAAFLVALKINGETAAELAGFARAMRERMIVVEACHEAVDNCGTGGDGVGTFNISTAAALVMAGAGARVAKHGNRSLSSQTGSADVFEALGVRISMTPEEASRAVREIGIGFLYAPNLHPAMKYAQPVRRELKMRTVFNLLGPLVNPARVRRQLVGAPSAGAARLMAEALAELGAERAFVVHGRDGLDEISTTGPTDVWHVSPDGVEHQVWSPATFGVSQARLESLAGGDAKVNAEFVRAILAGEPGPKRDIVLVNAAAGLVAAGLAGDLREGMRAATHSIDSGAARDKLELLKTNFPFA